MADQVITAQKLIDADKDATSLDTFINGTDSATVTTRKLRTYPSLAKAVKQVVETGGFEPFITEVALLASVPALPKKAAKALDTKKVWVWDSTKWNDTGLSELDLANNYTDKKSDLLAKSFNYSRYTSFSDDHNNVMVDGKGILLFSDYLFKQNSMTYFKVRFAGFNDLNKQEVDKNGVLLNTVEAKTEIETIELKGIYYDINLETSTLKVSWQHSKSELMQTEWKPNGNNNLFNFYALRKAPIVHDIKKATWSNISVEASDYLPPMQIAAVSNGDGNDFTGGSTGGSHLIGAASTARATSINFFVDGQLVTESSTGFSDCVSVKTNNELMASNTVSLGRYVLNQSFLLNFKQFNCEIFSKVTAKEPVKFRREGGPQLIGTGYTVGAHFYNGKDSGTTIQNLTSNSGSKENNPNVWACVLSGTNGFAVSWLDRNYGVKTDYVGAGKPMAYRNGGLTGATAGSWKFYHAVVELDAGSELQLNTGEYYSWHGGYAWYPKTSDNVLDAFLFNSFNKKCIGASVLNNNAELPLPPHFITDYKDMEVTCDGLVLSSQTYTAKFIKEA